jgi:hypothetical protein
MAAYAYLNKIGPRNTNFIKSVMMAAPYHLTDCGMYGEDWNLHTWMQDNEVYDCMPFPHPRNTPYNWWHYARLNFTDAWCMWAWKLTTAYRLETLGLVIAKHPTGQLLVTTSEL